MITPTNRNSSLTIGHYRYKQSDLLGQGFSSKVYKAHHLTKKFQVALKIIQIEKIHQGINKKLLQSELSCLQKLKSTLHVLNLLDVVKTEKFIYVITQLCKGDLGIRDSRRFSQKQAWGYIKQIIKGYKALHQKGIIHRDIKPENMFVKTQGHIKLGDFGFAAALSQAKKQSNYNIGSPSYMAPQVLLRNDYSHSSDIWSIGVSYYQLLTGRVPWNGVNEKQLKNQITRYGIKEVIDSIDKVAGVPISQKSKDFLRDCLEFDAWNRIPYDQLFQYQIFQSKTVKLVRPTSFKSQDKYSQSTIQSIKNIGAPATVASTQNLLTTARPVTNKLLTPKANQNMSTNSTNKIETKQKVLGVQNKKIDNKTIKKNSETGTSNNNDGNQNIQRRIKQIRTKLTYPTEGANKGMTINNFIDDLISSQERNKRVIHNVNNNSYTNNNGNENDNFNNGNKNKNISNFDSNNKRASLQINMVKTQTQRFSVPNNPSYTNSSPSLINNQYTNNNGSINSSSKTNNSYLSSSSNISNNMQSNTSRTTNITQNSREKDQKCSTNPTNPTNNPISLNNYATNLYKNKTPSNNTHHHHTQSTTLDFKKHKASLDCIRQQELEGDINKFSQESVDKIINGHLQLSNLVYKFLQDIQSVQYEQQRLQKQQQVSRWKVELNVFKVCLKNYLIKIIEKLESLERLETQIQIQMELGGGLQQTLQSSSVYIRQQLSQIGTKQQLMNYIFPSIGTNNNSKNHNPSKNKSINKMISNSLYRKTKMLIKNYKIRYENNEQLSKYWPKAKQSKYKYIINSGTVIISILKQLIQPRNTPKIKLNQNPTRLQVPQSARCGNQKQSVTKDFLQKIEFICIIVQIFHYLNKNRYISNQVILNITGGKMKKNFINVEEVLKRIEKVQKLKKDKEK